MTNKKCAVCSVVFPRPKCCANKIWENRKTCSTECRLKLMKINKIGFQVGHPVYGNPKKFTKGQIPWNKGQTGLQPWMNTSGLIKDGSLNRGKPMSIEQKKKLSDAHKGKKYKQTQGNLHWNWKGGITEVYKKIRNMSEFKLWRKKVYERDNHSCVFCQHTGHIHADHIKPLSVILKQYNIWSPQEARKCLELWDVSNGRTLCVSCHRQTKTYGGKVNTY